MVDYHHSEAEQIESVKYFWKRWGNLISAVVIAACVAYLGWQYWSGRNQQAREQAAAYYLQYMDAVMTGQTEDMASVGKRLKENYPQSAYAQLVSLYEAKEAVQAEDFDGAKDALTWVQSHASGTPYYEVATIRLARLQMAQQDYDAALGLLSDMTDINGFATIVDELKGDIYLQQGNVIAAAQAYQSALAAIPASVGQRPWLQMKFDKIKENVEVNT